MQLYPPAPPVTFPPVFTLQVLIDDHTEDRTVVNSQDAFVGLWVDLVTKLSAIPIVKQRLMIDILNEPE